MYIKIYTCTVQYIYIYSIYIYVCVLCDCSARQSSSQLFAAKSNSSSAGTSNTTLAQPLQMPWAGMGLQNSIELRAQQRPWATLAQPFQHDLQRGIHSKCALTQFPKCLEISSEEKPALYLWFKDKHYEWLTRGDRGSWVQDLTGHSNSSASIFPVSAGTRAKCSLRPRNFRLT